MLTLATRAGITLCWSKRTSRQALILEAAGSSPARSTQDPIVDSPWVTAVWWSSTSGTAALPVSFNGRTFPC